jgi:hypothetical protein
MRWMGENMKQNKWNDLVVRFHVTANGGTFVNKECGFNAMKRKVVSKKTKTPKGTGSPRTFLAFPELLPLVQNGCGKEVVDILGRLLLVVDSLDIIEVLQFHIW